VNYSWEMFLSILDQILKKVVKDLNQNIFEEEQTQLKIQNSLEKRNDPKKPV